MNTTTESNQSASTVPVTLKKEDGQDSPAEQETKGEVKVGCLFVTLSYSLIMSSWQLNNIILDFDNNLSFF